jgi:hypothetical protein
MRDLRGFLLTLALSGAFFVVFIGLLKSYTHSTVLVQIADEIKLIDNLVLEELVEARNPKQLVFETAILDSTTNSIILKDGSSYKFRILKVTISEIKTVQVDNAKIKTGSIDSKNCYSIGYDFKIEKNSHRGVRFKSLSKTLGVIR